MDGVHVVLGASLVGAYLHGSAVLGGLQPRSDLDVIAVAARSTSAEEKRRLVELLLELSARSGSIGPPRPIEFDVVVQSEIRPWRYPPPFDFHYDELLRERFEEGELEPWSSATNKDLASVITMARLEDASLAGPPSRDVFEPVPKRDYVDAILRDTATVDQYLVWDTRNVVLTLPRIWSAIATDDVRGSAARNSRRDRARRSSERVPAA